MYDLKYLDDSESREPIQSAISRKFPSAKFEDASDDIHWNRFAVELPDGSEREFFRLAVREGFALCCLNIGLMVRIKPAVWLQEELAELKAARTKAEGKS